jgi:hypothetical protein
MRLPLRRLLRRLVSGIILFAGRLLPPQSAWERITARIPAAAFGPGSRRQFTHYFERESVVRVESIDDIVDWLLTCEYASDTDLFEERDFWQHPSAFERLRRGDCEDFALWTWRKLSEMGIEAEFYVGRVRSIDEARLDRRHAWVVYRADGMTFLFEPAARSRHDMIHRLEHVMDIYVPHFAVNRDLRTFAFGGYVLDARRRKGHAVEGRPCRAST